MHLPFERGVAGRSVGHAPACRCAKVSDCAAFAPPAAGRVSEGVARRAASSHFASQRRKQRTQLLRIPACAHLEVGMGGFQIEHIGWNSPRACSRDTPPRRSEETGSRTRSPKGGRPKIGRNRSRKARIRTRFGAAGTM